MGNKDQQIVHRVDTAASMDVLSKIQFFIGGAIESSQEAVRCRMSALREHAKTVEGLLNGGNLTEEQLNRALDEYKEIRREMSALGFMLFLTNLAAVAADIMLVAHSSYEPSAT